MSVSGAPRMPTSFAGSITEEVCTSHKRVEWNFEIPLSKAMSQVFEIANQRYMLEFISQNGYLLRLYRMGPPIHGPAGSVRWWAGLKRGDGTYHHRNAFGDLNLEEDFPDWMEATVLLLIESWELEKYSFKPITVFFQMKVEQSSTTAEACTHDSARDIFPPSDGTTNEEQCNSHKHVEWIVKYTDEVKCWTSPVFESGNQLYRLMFSGTDDKKALRLFRLGPSEDGPGSSVRWWAGRKRAEGTYHHENESGTLHLQSECELWSEVALLMPAILNNMIKYYLAPGKRLAFTFWMNVESGAQMCNHGRRSMFPTGVGTIETEEWSSYKLVRWNVDYSGEEDFTSPIFRIGDQLYLFELECSSYYRNLRLFRMGRSVDKALRWWVGARQSDKMHHDHGTETNELDLSIACDLWIFVQVLHAFEAWEDEEEMNSHVIDFLMSLEQPSSAGLCAEGQIQDTSYLDHVLFKVKHTTFMIHRAIVCFRVPQMRLLHHSINSANGIREVLVTDCEPTVFQEFLKLVESGFSEVPTADNALALYVLARTYLLENLKEMCVKLIPDTISVDSFFDVVRVCFEGNEEGLLDSVTSFLSRNHRITKSAGFANFVAENPHGAAELMAKAFPRQEE